MNNELVGLFNNRVDTLVAPYSGQRAIVVFIGLGPLAAHALLARPDSLSSLSGSPIPMKADGIDVAALFEKSQIRAARDIVEETEGPIVCLYEQFKPLAKSLCNTFEGTVVFVFKNQESNEFTP